MLGLVVVAGGGFLLFHHSAPAPTPAPPPAPVASVVNQRLRFTPGYYQGTVADDAARFGIAAPPLAAMEAPFPYFDELEHPVSLKGSGDDVETRHLRITTSTRPADIGREGETMRGEITVLRIENKTDRPLAYRVETTVADSRRCAAKPTLLHDAVAIAAHGVVERSECVAGPNEGLALRRVEVVEVPALGYYYLSELNALHLGLDPRTAIGHRPPQGSVCLLVPEDVIEGALARKTATWRDVMDFYARHTCKEYAFFPGYRASDAPRATLPAVPPGAE